MKIKTEEITCYGSRNGWKVYLDGHKWPKKRTTFYTCMDRDLAIKAALNESEGKEYNAPRYGYKEN